MRRRVGVACLLALASSAAAAQQRSQGDSLADLDLEQLARVKITSVSRGPENVGQAMAAVFVISQDDIRRAGATSLPEALRLAPGLQVERLGAQNWSITSRGFADFTTNKLLVLVDGRAIYSPLFAGVFWDSQIMPLDDVERIEVILGPGGTLWGSNAVNGVINVVTRAATSTTGALVGVRAGTEQHINTTARYGLPLGRSGAIRFYGTYLDREPIELADGSDAEDAWQSGGGGFRMDLDRSARTHLTLQGDAYRASSEQTVREALPDPPFARSVTGPVDLNGFNLLGRWSRQTGEASDLQVQAYFDRTVRDQQPSVGRTAVNIGDIELQHRFLAGRRHSIVWGAGYRIADGGLDGTFTTALDPAQRTTHLAMAYVRDDIELVPARVALAVGSKVEWNSYTGIELQPEARLRWTPGSRHTFWGALSSPVRSPSRLDADIRFIAGGFPTSPPTYLQVRGNPDFASERLVEAELGYRGELSAHFSVDLSGYYGWYDELRTLTPGAPFAEDGHVIQPVTITNFGKGHSAGGTAAIIWRPAPRLQVRGSYTFLDMADTLDVDAAAGTTPNVNPGLSPEHQAGLGLYAALPGGVSLTLSGRYTSPLRNPRVGPYAEADARLGWSPSPRLTLAVVGRDLLQRRHAEFPGEHYLPRRGQLQLTWRF
jgi:iron complex outermembrane receptor protein